jgi:hypothetical protein
MPGSIDDTKPLAEASFEAVRLLVWQLVRLGIIPAESFARALEMATDHRSENARVLLNYLAGSTRCLDPHPGADD